MKNYQVLLKKELLNYDFRNTDTVVNANGINRIFENNSIFEGYRFIINIVREGIIIELLDNDFVIFRETMRNKTIEEYVINLGAYALLDFIIEYLIEEVSVLE